jgi:hypothetical protein
MREIGEKQGWHYCQMEHEEFGIIDILTNKPCDIPPRKNDTENDIKITGFWYACIRFWVSVEYNSLAYFLFLGHNKPV